MLAGKKLMKTLSLIINDVRHSLDIFRAQGAAWTQREATMAKRKDSYYNVFIWFKSIVS